MLRPSDDFVFAHKLKAYSWLTLGSATAVMAVPALVAAAAGGVGYYYAGIYRVSLVHEQYAGITDLVIDPQTGFGVRNPLLDDYESELNLWGNVAIASSAAGFAFLFGAAAGGLVSMIAWIFIENPWRYDAAMEAETG